MYINKGIYTYIPIPDPETPNPEPRRPRLGEENEQLFGLLSQAALGKYLEEKVPRAACLVTSALVQ